MGYYIQVPNNKNKAQQISMLYGGQIIPKPRFNEIPADKALMVVVDNGPFEAAGLAYDEAEFSEFTALDDIRRKMFVLMDKQQAYKLSGFKQ